MQDTQSFGAEIWIFWSIYDGWTGNRSSLVSRGGRPPEACSLATIVPINRKKEDIQRRRIQEQASVNIGVELSLLEGNCIIAMEPLLGGFICRCDVPDTYPTTFV